MLKDQIYDIKIINKPINNKKMAILILLIVVAMELILVAKNAIAIIQQHKVYKQYEAQLATLAKQEEVEPMEEPEEKVENMPKLTEEARNNIQTIYQSETKRAFLTFDDGPSTVTPAILDVLKQENVKASFFVLGSRVNAMPEMTKRIYDEGHYVANHGYSHSYSAIYASPQAVLDEFNECNKAVRNAIGVSDYHSHLFRFPGGLPGGKYAEIKRQAKELLSQNDIVNIDWNALTGDAETANPTVEFEMQRIQETVNNKSSVVILMHDAQAKAVTAEALPQIISWLRENGYEFKNFYEIMK